MEFKIDDEIYSVIINKKKIKNAYIRVNKDLEIVISINHFALQSDINRLITSNRDTIIKMINKQLHKKKNDDKFYYLGDEYNIILNDSFFDIDIVNKRIYIENMKQLDKYIKTHMQEVFEERLEHNFNYMNLGIKYPKLKIRKMTSRWGVCNRRNHSITLNFELFKKSIVEIDYVIIHELSHFKYFDHSRNFWGFVGTYMPDYKKIRKILKQ